MAGGGARGLAGGRRRRSTGGSIAQAPGAPRRSSRRSWPNDTVESTESLLTLGASASTYIAAALLIAALVFIVLAGVVTALKGKWGVFFLGILFNVLWIIGAIRPARADSYWARKFWRPSDGA